MDAFVTTKPIQDQINDYKPKKKRKKVEKSYINEEGMYMVEWVYEDEIEEENQDIRKSKKERYFSKKKKDISKDISANKAKAVGDDKKKQQQQIDKENQKEEEEAAVAEAEEVESKKKKKI